MLKRLGDCVRSERSTENKKQQLNRGVQRKLFPPQKMVRELLEPCGVSSKQKQARNRCLTERPCWKSCEAHRAKKFDRTRVNFVMNRYLLTKNSEKFVYVELFSLRLGSLQALTGGLKVAGVSRVRVCFCFWLANEGIGNLKPRALGDF